MADPPERQIFGPEQSGFTGARRIPSVGYEIHTVGAVTAERSYKRLMKRIKRRPKSIAPKLIGPSEVPVTPLPNPVTGPSFYTINITDAWEPNYSVNIMIDDTNSYIGGFRRHIRGPDGVWRAGKLYRYTNASLPKAKGIHDNAVDLGFNSSHADSSKTKPGDIYVLHEMFMILAKFEDCPRNLKTKRLIDSTDGDKVKEALSVAIVVFGEATRFRSIFKAIVARIRYEMNSCELHGTHWDLIHGWDRASGYLLNLDIEGLPALDAEAPDYFSKVQVTDLETGQLKNLSRIDDIIGDDGEIMLVLADEDLVIDPKERIKLEKEFKKPGTLPITDPGFPEEDDEEEAEAEEEEEEEGLDN